MKIIVISVVIKMFVVLSES